jgi:hypothetical protein
MHVLKALGQLTGIDADDLKVLLVGLVAVFFIGVGLVLLAAFAGCAVATFEAASGLF